MNKKFSATILHIHKPIGRFQAGMKECILTLVEIEEKIFNKITQEYKLDIYRVVPYTLVLLEDPATVKVGRKYNFRIDDNPHDRGCVPYRLRIDYQKSRLALTSLGNRGRLESIDWRVDIEDLSKFVKSYKFKDLEDGDIYRFRIIGDSIELTILNKDVMIKFDKEEFENLLENID